MTDPAKFNDMIATLRRAHAAQMAGQLDEADALYRGVLATDPKQFDALHMLGLIAARRERYGEADGLIQRALDVNPRSAVAYNNRGNVLSELHRFDEALAAYDSALALRPDYPDAMSNRALVLQELNRPDEALAIYDQALALNPNHVEALYNRGNALRDLKRLEEALASYDRAVALNPAYADALSNRGNVLVDLMRFPEALESYERALKVRPDFPAALNNRGNCLLTARHYEEAAADFAQVVALQPDYQYAKGLLLHARMHCCEWDSYSEQVAQVEAGTERGERICTPFAFQAFAETPRASQLCSQIYARDVSPAWANPVASGRRYGHRKIRVGYLAGEFRAQATSFLMVGLFEQHNKDRFEIHAFDNGVADRSTTRARLEAAFDSMTDITGMTDVRAAQFIAEREIDILVNLNGYFGQCRNGVFAAKAAPIQVNYLGFPATMGAPYLDYILADRCVLPEDERKFYDEKVVYLPECYQANDNRREIAANAPSRAESGLPDSGFVYC